MVPAKTQCPTDWTVEYVGYLMTQWYNTNGRSMYECVDKNPESIPGLNADNYPRIGRFHLVEPYCDDLACPPIVLKKNLLVLFVPDNKLQDQANCKDRKDYSFVHIMCACIMQKLFQMTRYCVSTFYRICRSICSSGLKPVCRLVSWLSLRLSPTCILTSIGIRTCNSYPSPLSLALLAPSLAEVTP